MINKQIILGNVGKVEDLKGVKQEVLEFSVATENNWKDDKGEWHSETEWHTVKAFGKRAKYIDEKIDIGDLVYLEGQTKTEKWETKNGEKRSRKVVYLNDFKLLPRKKEDKAVVEEEEKTE